MKEPAKTTQINQKLDEALDNTFPASDPVAMQSSIQPSSPTPFHEKETSLHIKRFCFKVMFYFLLAMAVLSFIFKAF